MHKAREAREQVRNKARSARNLVDTFKFTVTLRNIQVLKRKLVTESVFNVLLQFAYLYFFLLNH